MVCIDQGSGQRSREPLLTLSATRGRRMPFGVHLGPADTGSGSNALLAVGQPVSYTLRQHGEEEPADEDDTSPSTRTE